MRCLPDIHSVTLSDSDRAWVLGLLESVPGLRQWAESIDPMFLEDLVGAGVLLARRRDTE